MYRRVAFSRIVLIAFGVAAATSAVAVGAGALNSSPEEPERKVESRLLDLNGIKSIDRVERVDDRVLGGALRLVVADDQRCLLDRRGGGTCKLVSQIELGRGIRLEFCTTAELLVYGLAPSHTSTVEVLLPNGVRRAAALADGVFALTASAAGRGDLTVVFRRDSRDAIRQTLSVPVARC